ncbi:hypothetical protein CEP14_15685 [Cylindrospermopsis raciborskii C04]|nr:hypothetical protein CEP14_15685 [Cylindrospermopsis raciborskii C04]
MDNSTEKEVMAAIEGLSHQLTVILIAHLDQGQVYQEGDRDGDSPTNSATGGVVGATGGTDPAIVSTSIRSTG